MFASPAYAQTAAGPDGMATALIQFVPLIAIFVIFYFLLIRPQQRRAKAFQEMVAGVKKGDEVVTAGGLIGKVTKVADNEIEVELGPNNRVRVRKGMLAEVSGRTAPSPANDAKA